MKAIDLRGDRDGYKRPVTREDYAPYHTMPEFQHGYDDYMAGRRRLTDPDDVGGQAYDRGAEYAMRIMRGGPGRLARGALGAVPRHERTHPMRTFKFGPPSGNAALHIRRMVEWTRDAKTRPESYTNGQHFARCFAGLHGYAVILWNDDHTTLFVAD